LERAGICAEARDTAMVQASAIAETARDLLPRRGMFVSD
jgi:hypothetical protein